MTTATQAFSAEQPAMEMANTPGGHGLDELTQLKEVVTAQVAEFGAGRYGTTVDETTGLQSAVEAAEMSALRGDLVSGQQALERAPRPRKMNEEVRDSLVELHQAERGVPTSERRLQAVSSLQLDVVKEISALTNPDMGNLHYTHPDVQARKAVEAAFQGRHHNYLEDHESEDVLMQNGEQRTPHEVSDDAYDVLLAYTEDKLRDPSISSEKAEELRVARDTLHLERKVWKEQYDAQNQAIDTVMNIIGQDNPQFTEAKIRAAVRDCVGDKIPRLQELIDTAQETADPIERFNILNDLQNNRGPIQSADEFEAWKQNRADKMKAAEEQESTQRADEARQTIESIQSGREVQAVQPSASEKTTSKETEIAPVPTGWTELVHGTSSDRWQQTGDIVTITGGGLSAISREDIARGAGKTTESYARTKAANGNPIEVRVAFYREDLSPRRGVLPDAAEVKAELSQETLKLISRYHQDRHPLIPSGEKLLKIGETIDSETRRQVEHYVPQSVAADYIEAVKRETGKDIKLPSPSLASEQTAEPTATPQVSEQSQAETSEARVAAQERQPNPSEQFVKAAITRIPQDVLLESLAAVSRDKAANGEQVTISSLRQTLTQKLSGELPIDAAKLNSLARRIQQNGFHESSGGIWSIQAGPNTLQGQIASDARKLVREIIGDILR